MKKIISLVLALALAAVLAGCGDSGAGKITTVSREQGSGTRGAFVELFKIEQKDASGKKVDMTRTDSEETSSTAVMLSTIAGNKNAIGYVSLGALNSTVKALEIDGAAATVENIKNGSYKVSRPFNVVTKGALSGPAADFMAFIVSAEGQKVVEKSGYIGNSAAPAYKRQNVTGKIVVAGSSSVTPLMEKLKEAYLAINSGVEITVQQTDSTSGVTSVIEGVCDIGMASRELKESEIAKGVASSVIATDGIAVIVNKENTLKGLTAAKVMEIYTGKINLWSEVVNG